MFRAVFLLVLLAAVMLPAASHAQDPNDWNTVDTFRIIPTTLIVGQSVPVYVWVTNDEILGGIWALLPWRSTGAGFARLDSIVFGGRLANSLVLDGRQNNVAGDGTSPDTALLLLTTIHGQDLFPGAGVIFSLYMTGLEPGEVVFDSLNLPEDDERVQFVTREALAFVPYCEPETLMVQAPTDAGDRDLGKLPVGFALHQNYPNPFNPATTVSYNLPKASHVRLEIFNVLGQKIVTLVDRAESAGSKQVVWDGRNEAGEAVGSGMYFYRISAGEHSDNAKMLLLK